jgi:RNA polymerase sigma-70 factor (ECF subfamily)
VKDLPTVAPSPEALCNRYAERVFRFASMVSRGSSEAEDIAQEALIRAIRKLHTFDPRKGNLEQWLWSIVVRTARDAGRATGRRIALWERLSRQQNQSESVETMALERLSDAELIAAVRALHVRDRTLIALRFGAGLDHATAGEAVGISAAAATMAIRRALAKLRTQLEGTHEPNA